MGVELTWTFEDDAKDPNVNLDLGDLETLTEQLRPAGNVRQLREVLSKMEPGSGAVIENGVVSLASPERHR